MNRFLQWLDRLVGTLGTGHAALGHVTLVHDHCPHCDARTLCEVHVLSGYQRCLQCGRRPSDRRSHNAELDQTDDLVAA